MTEKFRYKICDIETKTDDGIIVNFDGFGIFFKVKTNREQIKVKYKGEIGKSNFKIELV